jgi:tryptophan synthase beta chain
MIGTTAGPHPYPQIVRNFQSVIGRETKRQIRKIARRYPDVLIACVGGGSNAMGMFYPFRNEKNIALYGVEAAGHGLNTSGHSASINAGKVGVLHGNKTYLLQDDHGQVRDAYSIAAGLDYPGVGPEHAYFHAIKKVKYVTVTDKEAINAFSFLSRQEGIIPALESAHALAYAMKITPKMAKNKIIVICLSGRGDKDAQTIMERGL